MASGRIGYINFKQLGRSKIHRDTADYSGNGHRTKGDTHYLFYAVEFLCTVVSSDKIEGGLMKAVHCQVDKAPSKFSGGGIAGDGYRSEGVWTTGL